ncbi:MAG TPA: hypothetical protein VH643_25340 [Gemmataceae bacterium]
MLDDVVRITADPAARAEVNPLLRRLGLWIGLMFQPAVKGAKRIVQRLVSGRMVFGEGPLPLPLFGKDNVDHGPNVCGCAPSVPVAPARESEHNQEKPSGGECAGPTIARRRIVEDGQEEKQTVEEGSLPLLDSY